MPVRSAHDLEDQVLSVLRDISGAKEIGPDQMIGRDVGICGLDGVELVEALEERFGVDLDPLMRVHSHFLPLRWFDRLLGRAHGPANADLTVRELVAYIANESRRGETC